MSRGGVDGLDEFLWRWGVGSGELSCVEVRQLVL